MLAVGNDELGREVHAGDTIKCPECEQPHELFGGKDQDGNDTELLLAYHCGPHTRLAAIDNKLIARFFPDA